MEIGGIEEVLEEGQKALNDYLTRNYGGWKKIVRDGVEKGLNFAIEALDSSQKNGGTKVS